jgi:hypothetical protein
MATSKGKTPTGVFSLNFYTFLEFLEVCRKMKFFCVSDYKTRYKQDPKLPSNPNLVYGGAWIDGGGWACVTGKKKLS